MCGVAAAHGALRSAVVTCGGDRRSRERRMVQNQATRAIMGRKERERERRERGEWGIERERTCGGMRGGWCDGG